MSCGGFGKTLHTLPYRNPRNNKHLLKTWKNTCLFGYSPVIRPPVAPLRKPPAKKKLFAHAKPTPRYRYTGNKIGEYKHLSFRKRRRSPPGTFESDCLFFGRPGMRRGGGRPPAFPQHYWLVCVAAMLGKKRGAGAGQVAFFYPLFALGRSRAEQGATGALGRSFLESCIDKKHEPIGRFSSWKTVLLSTMFASGTLQQENNNACATL